MVVFGSVPAGVGVAGIELDAFVQLIGYGGHKVVLGGHDRGGCLAVLALGYIDTEVAGAVAVDSRGVQYKELVVVREGYAAALGDVGRVREHQGVLAVGIYIPCADAADGLYKGLASGHGEGVVLGGGQGVDVAAEGRNFADGGGELVYGCEAAAVHLDAEDVGCAVHGHQQEAGAVGGVTAGRDVVRAVVLESVVARQFLGGVFGVEVRYCGFAGIGCDKGLLPFVEALVVVCEFGGFAQIAVHECRRTVVRRVSDFDAVGLVAYIGCIVPSEGSGVDGAAPHIAAFVHGYKLVFKAPGGDFVVEVVADGLDGGGIGAYGLDAAVPVATPFGVKSLSFGLGDVGAY